MSNRALLACLCLLTPAVGFAMDIGANEAFAIASAYAIAQEPALDSDSTVVRRKETDKALVFTLSDPYYLNGDKFWRTYRHYEYTESTVTKISRLGDQVISSAATSPLPAEVPANLKPKVMEWLAFWDSQSSLDPELRLGAKKTKVYLYLFEQGSWGPYAIVGVDGEGNTFRPNVENPLFPWRARLRMYR